MKTTVKAVIKTARLTGEKATVYIRITKNRESTYINSGLTADVKYWNNDIGKFLEKKGQVIYNKTVRLNNLALQELVEQIEVIIAANPKATPSQIKQLFDNQQEVNNFDFLAFFKKYVEELKEAGRLGDAKNNNNSYNKLLKYNNNRSLPINQLTIDYCQGFFHYLKQTGLNDSTIAGLYKKALTLFNTAQRRQLIDIQLNNPFEKITRKLTIKANHRGLPKDEIVKLFNYQPIDKKEEIALDIFKLSYYLRGMNFKDLCYITESQINNDILSYKRSKTGKLYTITVGEEAKAIINKYAGNGEFILPFLNDRRKASEFNAINTNLIEVNEGLRLIGSKLGLSIKLTTYVARHSFATTLVNSGVDVNSIKDLLGHSKITTTQGYFNANAEKELSKQSNKAFDFIGKKK